MASSSTRAWNLFRMVDVAVVEDEDSSRARIWISEGNDKLLKELKEMLHVY